MSESLCECFHINNLFGINSHILQRAAHYIDLLLQISSETDASLAQPSINKMQNNTQSRKVHPLEQLVNLVEEEIDKEVNLTKHVEYNNATESKDSEVIEEKTSSNKYIVERALHNVISNYNENSNNSNSNNSYINAIYRHHVLYVTRYLANVSYILSRAVEMCFLEPLLQSNRHNLALPSNSSDYDIHVQLLPSTFLPEKRKTVLTSLTNTPYSFNNTSKKKSSSKIVQGNNETDVNVNKVFCALIVIRRKNILERRRRGQSELYKHYMNTAARGQTLHDVLEFWESVSYNADRSIPVATTATRNQKCNISGNAVIAKENTRSINSNDNDHVSNSNGNQCVDLAHREMQNASDNVVQINMPTFLSQLTTLPELMHFPLSTEEVELLEPLDFDRCHNWELNEAMLALSSDNKVDNNINGSINDNAEDEDNFSSRSDCPSSQFTVYNNNIRYGKRKSVILGSDDANGNDISLDMFSELRNVWQQPAELVTAKSHELKKNDEMAINRKRWRKGEQNNQRKANKNWYEYITHSQCGLTAVLYVSFEAVVYAAYVNKQYRRKACIANNTLLSNGNTINRQDVSKTNNANTNATNTTTVNSQNTLYKTRAWLLPLESAESFTRGLLKMS